MDTWQGSLSTLLAEQIKMLNIEIIMDLTEKMNLVVFPL